MNQQSLNTPSLFETLKIKFPAIIGFMLTGSQAASQTFSVVSDIDVVIFDLAHANVECHGFDWNGIMIDCTIVPVHDVHNALMDEANHKRGSVLSMITTGTIQFDTEGIVEEIKKNAFSLFEKLKQKSNSSFLDKVLSDLPTIKKYIQRGVSNQTLFFLLCDFVAVVSTAETHAITYFRSTFLRKASLLQNVNPSFCDELQQLFFETTDTGDTKKLLAFIDSYLDKYKERLPKKMPPSLMLNVHTGRMTAIEFIGRVTPALQQHPVIGQYFSYVFKTELKYYRTFKFDVCIVFNTSNPHGLPVEGILQQLTILFRTSGLVNSQMDVTEPALVDGMHESITNLREVIFRFYSTVITAHKSRAEVITIVLGICEEIYKKMALSTQDAFQATEMLCSRWLLPRPDSGVTLAGNDFTQLQDNRKKEMRAYFKSYREKLQQFKKTAAGINLDAVLTAMQKIFKDDTITVQKLLPDSYLNYLLIEDLQQTKTFSFLLAEVYSLFSLEEHEKMVCLYALQESIME